MSLSTLSHSHVHQPCVSTSSSACLLCPSFMCVLSQYSYHTKYSKNLSTFASGYPVVYSCAIKQETKTTEQEHGVGVTGWGTEIKDRCADFSGNLKFQLQEATCQFRSFAITPLLGPQSRASAVTLSLGSSKRVCQVHKHYPRTVHLVENR